MHELAVTQQLLHLALKRADAARVIALSVAIGELSTFSEDAVEFCWGHVARGTACEGATIRFSRIAAALTCRDCGHVHAWAGEPAPCPRCGSLRLDVTAGEDLLLESIDVETEPATHG